MTDKDSMNLNVVRIAELYVNRTDACTTGLWGIYTLLFSQSVFLVLDLSPCLVLHPNIVSPFGDTTVVRANQD